MDSCLIRFGVLCAALVLHSAQCRADETNSQPIDLNAESTTLDRNSNTASFTGLRIRQGDVVIQAEEATVRGFDSERSEWQLKGGVRIQINSAVIRANEGMFKFLAHQLTGGELSGNPAVFEESMPKAEGPVRGTAEHIYYDKNEGTVRMEDGASFTVGANEIKGCDLIYDLKQERVTSGSPECGEPFTITIVPPAKEPTTNEPARSP